MPVAFSHEKQLLHVLLAADDFFRELADKDFSVWVLVYFQIVVAGAQEVADDFVVDLHVRHGQHVLALRSCLNDVKDVCNREGGDAGLLGGAVHGVGLSGRRLSVRKHGAVDAVQTPQDNVVGYARVGLVGGRVLVQDVVELEGVASDKETRALHLQAGFMADLELSCVEWADPDGDGDALLHA